VPGMERLKLQAPQLPVMQLSSKYDTGNGEIASLFRQTVVRRVRAPHLPTVVLRVARLEAIQTSLTGGDVDPAFRNRRLELDRFANSRFPQQLAVLRGQTNDLAETRAK